MITESGQYEYDPELYEFYNFEAFGDHLLENENGVFLDSGGYIRYEGDAPLEDLFPRMYPPALEMTMDGMI